MTSRPEKRAIGPRAVALALAALTLALAVGAHLLAADETTMETTALADVPPVLEEAAAGQATL